MNVLTTRHFYLLVVLILSFSITNISFAQQQFVDREGLSEHTLIHDGVERQYLLYIPESYTGDEPLPMILNFHPLGANMTFQYAFTQFDRYADDYPAIVVTPQGLPADGGNEFLESEGLSELLPGEELSELFRR